jgi:polar amino acid transport system substrate-binding protein
MRNGMRKDLPPVTPAILADLAPTGVLRAALNYGNGVLVQRGDDEQSPRGVAPELARALARQLNVPVHFAGFPAAGQVFEALSAAPDAPARWDIAFLAIEPARAEQIAFTAPYVLIEGTYLVRKDSPIRSAADMDKAGHRISVGPNSAYHLYLKRTLQHATLVPAEIGGGRAMIELFLRDNLDAAAGVRQPLAAYAAEDQSVRVLDDSFMQIRQAMGVPRARQAEAAHLSAPVEKMKADGLVVNALLRSGQIAQVAPLEA